MIITETSTDTTLILNEIDARVRELQEQGVEPRFVVVGRESYTALREAMAARYGRSEGAFESYQWLTIVVDPFREDEVTVLPGPRALIEGVRAERL